MAAKAFELADVGTVHIYKRKGSKSLRLSIASDGKVRVTVPAWATYTEALRFVHARSQWIQQNLPQKPALLYSGQHVGKAHRMVFESMDIDDVRTRIAGSEIHIIRPLDMPVTDDAVQQAAHKAAIRAMRLEARKLLPVRLKQLAAQFGFAYTSVQVKQMKGRWGSCDNKQHIVLNLFLMQLPWHLIDYVLVHELTHTRHLNHSADFWDEFLRHEPKAKLYRKQIREHRPILETQAL